MTNIFNYIDRPSPIHRLTGATKLVCLLLWSFAAMLTYDTRMLILLPVLSFLLFYISRIKLRDVSFMLGFTAVFMVLNNVLVFAFSPQHGVELYGTKHVLFSLWGNYVLTQEQLFYHLNLVLKYLSTIPIVLLFVCTTNPSEFAASLNRIGVKYSVSYSVALALRYIPDIQREYHDISQAQQARGIEMSRKQSEPPAEMSDYGYGWQCWLWARPGSILFNGLFGQNILVIPDLDMVIASNAGGDRMFGKSGYLSLCETYFGAGVKLPDTCPPDPRAYRRLCRAVRQLEQGAPPERGLAGFLAQRRQRKLDEARSAEIAGRRYVFEPGAARLLPLFVQLST